MGPLSVGAHVTHPEHGVGRVVSLLRGGRAAMVRFDRLGALVTKTIMPDLRGGNPTPRVCEVGQGMLNSIGIPSKGIDHFLDQILRMGVDGVFSDWVDRMVEALARQYG